MAERLMALRTTRLGDSRFNGKDGQTLLAVKAGVNVATIIAAENPHPPSPGAFGQAPVDPNVEKRLEVALGVGSGALR
jgi:hypothetical protein